jgi:Pyruvate/2-oxoacid:ferredoxin oxidoreductase delta subunit
MTGYDGIFAGGDMVAGPHTVTAATGQGKKAAHRIDGWLRQQPHQDEPKHRLIGFADLHLPLYSDALAAKQTEIQPEQRVGFTEVTAGLSEKAALHEARRCLSCGNCYECDMCFAACPEDAISKLGPGQGYQVSMSLCTGCAVCFEQCPCHAIDMVADAPLRSAGA